ncbi:EutP/PduV family microcompartment system protein [Pseudovibrio sp. Ad37]|uniref:EutP/PduV family microcompartment system protein n=1 Tax=Pseudovibrio sp. Ad37 TaxID=989422 RepID=UPI0007AEC00E|nr:EutP/PduV family microcompartment system protein [Pseudovibrio sp. Ad37]KZL24417.1 hypothetical protein PsAD37_02665 [Pseudovibrio sp. Ad37]
MRIAITGTHGSGKTTLIEDFVDQHLNYEATQEPYWELAEYGVALSGVSSAQDYLGKRIETTAFKLSEVNERGFIS